MFIASQNRQETPVSPYEEEVLRRMLKTPPAPKKKSPEEQEKSLNRLSIRGSS